MTTRRSFLKTSGLAAIAGPVLADKSPPQPAILSPSHRKVLTLVGEAMLPGSANAGLVTFLDKQLALDASDSLLMIRYLGVPAPYKNFYLAALDGIVDWVKTEYDSDIEQLDSSQLSALVNDLASNRAGSFGPVPSGFFYFVLRADALDVVYGTRAGFDRLNMPYMAHIEPGTDW